MYQLLLVDPFDGLIVWGTFGLLAWTAAAALVGVGLHALMAGGRKVAAPVREHAPEAREDLSDAA